MRGFTSPEDFTIKETSLNYSDGSSYEVRFALSAVDSSQKIIISTCLLITLKQDVFSCYIPL